MKLQLNSLAALERLIGGDTEVEVEIRNSVVQAFAKKHLKSLADSGPVKEVMESTKRSIMDEIANQCQDSICTVDRSHWGSVKVKLHPNVLVKIAEEVKAITDNTIREAVNEAIVAWRAEPLVRELIEQRFEYYTKEFFNSEIKKRIEKMNAILSKQQ